LTLRTNYIQRLRVCVVFASQTLINTDNERIRTKLSKCYGKNNV
jgi:hypothetical protein